MNTIRLSNAPVIRLKLSVSSISATIVTETRMNTGIANRKSILTREFACQYESAISAAPSTSGLAAYSIQRFPVPCRANHRAEPSDSRTAAAQTSIQARAGGRARPYLSNAASGRVWEALVTYEMNGIFTVVRS